MARLRFKGGRLCVLVHAGYILAGMTGIGRSGLVNVADTIQRRAILACEE